MRARDDSGGAVSFGAFRSGDQASYHGCIERFAFNRSDDVGKLVLLLSTSSLRDNIH